MVEMEIPQQTEIQIQCMKDFALLQAINFNKENNTYIMQCPTCWNTFALIPLEPDNEPTKKVQKEGEFDTRSDQEIEENSTS